MSARTRIAPSPTGAPHLGTAFIALFNLCFARSQSGSFVLRMEDTDRLRSDTAFEREIIDALRWLGLEWDEGPDTGGACGPYRQSERTEIYRRYAEQLLEEERAFYCFATAEELEQMRREQIARGETARYDGRALQLSRREVQQRLRAGEPHVVRMKTPEEGQCVVRDMLRGEVLFDWRQVDMQVLLKQDGLPTYHLACVVDDHLMQISHVIRGEEWLNSTPKHLLLYRFFGWEPPDFCHLPLLRNPDHSKLSKRRNPTGVNYYRRVGFLPEALLNYLGRMGWSMPDEREKFSLQEMIDAFDLQRVSTGGPVFDETKLRWLNGEWIRSLPQEELSRRLENWLLNPDSLHRLLPHLQPRMERLSEIGALAGFLLGDGLSLTEESFSSCKLDAEKIREALQLCIWELEKQRTAWKRETIFAALSRLADILDVKLRDFLAPLFIAVTGARSSFSIADALELLGPELGLYRLRSALTLLGGLSKKKTQALEKRLSVAEKTDAPDAGGDTPD